MEDSNSKGTGPGSGPLKSRRRGDQTGDEVSTHETKNGEKLCFVFTLFLVRPCSSRSHSLTSETLTAPIGWSPQKRTDSGDLDPW